VIYNNCSKQEERRRNKTPAHTLNIQSNTDGISQQVKSGS